LSFGENDISREARVRIKGNQFKGPESDSYGIYVTAAGQDALERAERMLEGIPNGIQKALNSAINRATAHLRSVSTRAVRERYAISAANLRAEENVSVAYTYQNGVQAYVHFSGKRIPLFRFDGARPAQPTYDESRRVPVLVNAGAGKWRLGHPGMPAYGHVLKSTSPKQFENAFVARMNSTGHIGIWERTGGATSSKSTDDDDGYYKDEIEELYGPSVPQMLGSQEVAEKLTNEAMKSFEKNLDQYVYALLNGYVGVR